MRKLSAFLVICCIFGVTIISGVKTAYAENKTTYFAKVQSTGVQLCESPSESTSIFEIPYSYFVEVESIVDDYFKVTYKDISGYVKKDKVKLMNGIPQTPFAQANFKLFVPFSLYASPTKTSKKTLELDDSVEQITYYGTKSGQQVTSNNNTWYYSSVQMNGQTYHGYIFSGVTDYLSKINVNNETFDVLDEGILDASSTEFTSLSIGTKIMLIVSISIPSILILYFLIKPSKIMQVTKNRKQVKKDNKKVHHGDYFEFDESEL